jgi:RNA polymerase sigma factor (sigma-70 family)
LPDFCPVGYYMDEMQQKSDAQLLRDYADHGAEAAFAEIVARHTNLVYSAALRQVDSPDIAAEVAQNVFIALARGARTLSGKLAENASLAGWLCRSARNISLNLRRDEFRRHSRERQAMEQLDSIPEAAPDWERLRPVLDEAMSELSEPDYDALVLRFFKNQDLRSVGLALGVSDDAAQKRVARALDKLRDLVSQRGVTASAAALCIVLPANAVQSAPAGLAATISTAAALAGTTIATTATATVTKAIAMTTLQKTLVTATVAVLAGAGLYDTRQASQLRGQVQTLQQQQAPLAEQIERLNQALNDARNQMAALREDNERLNRNSSELLKLRAEVGRLKSRAGIAATAEDSMLSAAKSLVERIRTLQQRLDAAPSAKIPELQLLTDADWADAARGNLDTESDFRKAFSFLRDSAVHNFLHSMSAALRKYKQTHGGDVPLDLSQLKPYFETPPSDEVLQRYQILSNKVLPSFSTESAAGQAWSVTLKEVIDGDNDTLFELGQDGSVGGASYRDVDALKVLEPAMRAFAANAPTNAGGRVAFSPQQLLPYLKTPEEKAAYEKLTRSRSPDLK